MNNKLELNISKLTLNNDSLLEDIAEEIQKYTDKVIVVVNNNVLRWYEEKELPLQNLVLERDENGKYVLYDNIKNETLTFFSYKSLKKALPSIDSYLKKNQSFLSENINIVIKEKLKCSLYSIRNREIVLYQMKN